MSRLLALGSFFELGGSSSKDLLVRSDQVHLVHARHQVGPRSSVVREGVAAATLVEAVARVDQDDRHRSAVDAPVTMIPGVLNVTRGRR